MNWYKKTLNVQAFNLRDVMKGMAIPFSVALLVLGLNHIDFSNMVQKRHGGDETAAKRQIVEDATKKVMQGFDHERFTSHITQYEGFRNAVYNDGRGYPTIGVGHLIKPESRGIFKSLFGDTVNYDAIVSGQAKLTDEQVNQLAKYDIDIHLNRAKNMFPKFDTYPYYVKEALLNSVYRGDTGSKTVALINAGKWEEAAGEYTNRHDYQNATSLGVRGIIKRMDANRDAMLEYAKQLKG